MGTLPALTPEQRASALLKAKQSRTERADVKRHLKKGAVTLPLVFDAAATNDAIAKMRVSALLKAMPGVGKIRAAQIMEQAGIAPNRTVRGLGVNQRAALEAEFAA
jgi:hypothetical protein